MGAATQSFKSAPAFATADRFTTTIDRDPADIYFPRRANLGSDRDLLPVALILQGANVDKSHYSIFGRYFGSIWIYCSRTQSPAQVSTDSGCRSKDVAPEQQQLVDVLAYMQAENVQPSSPLLTRSI